MDRTDPTEMLERAIHLAIANVGDGEQPFAALVRLPGGEVVEGVNRILTDHDPTAHAEIVALRAACAQVGAAQLPGAVLFSSCEPCTMCLAAALWAGVDEVVFAAGRADAARAGFGDEAVHDYFARPGHHALLPTAQHRHADAVAPFVEWARLSAGH